MKPEKFALAFGALGMALSHVAPAQGVGPAPVELPNDIRHWKDSGFEEMVPPVRLPTDKEGDDLIQVWLKLPENGKVSVSWIDAQKRYSLVYPPGTIADRVEGTLGAAGESIDDVRGSSIGSPGDPGGAAYFHVYEQVPGDDGTKIRGYEWKRGGTPADVAAGEALIKLYFPPGQNWDPDVIATFRMRNRCAQCHEPNAPEPTTTAPPFRFETDSQGWFQPLTVLADRMTLRDHRDWDVNADDPFISVWCGTTRTQAVTDGDTRGYHCPGDAAPVGVLDLRDALQKHDPRARKVCDSREYVFRHMDQTAQSAFRDAIGECR